MSREYRAKPADVVARRIDSADRAPGKPVDGTAGRALALLSMTGDDSDHRDGRRAVARYVRDSHGCDRAVLAELLDVLGLGGQR